MNNSMASLVYRRAATQHATVVGLVIALHDTLIGNLKRAAEAMKQNDIETRCAQLIHGFRVLTQLEAMLDMNNGGKTAVNIQRFYRHLRRQMLAAQFKLDAGVLETQMQLVLEVREAWQQVEGGSAQMNAVQSTGASYGQGAGHSVMEEMDTPRVSFSCTG